MKPRLTFFCELEAGPLLELFAGRAVLDSLAAVGGAVSLGLIDLSDDRASVVRRLNRAGIPVVAWLLLPKEEGYWFNTGNVLAAARRYGAFTVWSREQRLRWSSVGLDIETDIQEMRQLLVQPALLLPTLLGRLVNGRQLASAQAGYAALLAEMRADGFRLDSYQMPLIVDERRAGSQLLRRLAGWVDLPVDREVLMLYSSFYRPLGGAILASYARQAGSVGVGVTGGGVQIEGVQQAAFLTWDEFRRDLLLASGYTDDIHIFSLEGCVQQGFLQRLADVDWDTLPDNAPALLDEVNVLRALLGAALKASNHPGSMVLALLALMKGARRRSEPSWRSDGRGRRAT